MAVTYAIEDDVPRIVELARHEFDRSQHAAHTRFDPEQTAMTVRDFMRDLRRVVLVTPGGYLLGQIQPSGFSRERVAVEFAFYAEDGSGAALRRHFEGWAQSLRAAYVVMHDFLGDPERRLSRVLERRYGYTQLGVALIKRF